MDPIPEDNRESHPDIAGRALHRRRASRAAELGVEAAASRDPADLAAWVERRRVGTGLPSRLRYLRDVAALDTLVPAMLRQTRVRNGRVTKLMHEAWRVAVGGDEALLKTTRVVGIRTNILRVEVASPALRHRLQIIERDTLLERFSAALRGRRRVLDIAFTLGVFELVSRHNHTP